MATHPNTLAVDRIVQVRRDLDRVEADLDRVQGSAPNLVEQRELKATADRYAPIYRDLELPQPQPQPGETPIEYRIRNARGLRRWSSWKDGTSRTFAALAEAGGLDAAEREITETARKRADNPHLGKVGAPAELRKVDRYDEFGRHTETVFHGNPLSWMQNFTSPIVSCLKAVGDGRGNWLPRGGR